MDGTVVNPAPVSGVNTGASNALSASYVNSFRITAVATRLALHVRSTDKNDTVEFFNLCLSLARGIDYAIANSEVLSIARGLPILLKKVCQRRNDFLLQAAIMVLMISVKNACENGWFSYKDSEDLRTLANEIGSAFCSTKDIKTETSSLPTILGIMSRFYPQIRMGQILAFLNAKPGYDAYVIDFHILKNVNCSPEDKIRLVVAQTDNTETSSCIISPQQVNFLLNGRGVDRRTNLLMDTGPQVPTNVTHMLKYGTNLLQAVGQFNGNYIIIVAFMRMAATPVRPCLPDYVQPTVAAVESDSEVIEGSSRISLNCPISFRRIKTPVKGHSCKHLQCFDFDNYVDINSRRPSWRCPHCNQSVCFTDIHIDQKIVKILEEVGENVADVIISADGSWKAVIEGNDQIDKQHDKILNCNPDVVPQLESAIIANAPPEILDLTEGDDEMDAVSTCEHEDMKPFSANNPCQLNVKNSTINQDITNTSELNHNIPSHIEDDFWSGVDLSMYGQRTSNASLINTSELNHNTSTNNSTINQDITNTSELNHNTPSHVEDDFWSGIDLSMYGQGTSNSGLDAHSNGGVSESVPINHMLSPLLTDATSPALDQEPEALRTTALTTSVVQSQFSAPGSTPLQQFGTSNMINEYGRSPSISRHVNRTPVADQALPAQTPTSTTQQRSRMASQPSPTPLTTDGSSTAFSNVERQQQSRSHLNSLQGSYMSSSSLQQQIGNWGPHGHLFSSSRPSQQINGRPAQQIHTRPALSQHPSGYRVSPVLATESQNSHQHQAISQRMPYLRTQSPSLNRLSTHLPQFKTHQGGLQNRVSPTPVGGHQQDQFLVAPQRAFEMARMQSPSPSVQVQTPRTSSSIPVNVDGYTPSGSNTRATVHPVTRPDGLVDSSVAEQDWRPTGRMRGSLSGQAYSAALSQYISLPTQPVQPAARPLASLTTSLSVVPPPLHGLTANSRNSHSAQASTAGISGALQEQSSGMN